MGLLQPDGDEDVIDVMGSSRRVVMMPLSVVSTGNSLPREEHRGDRSPKLLGSFSQLLTKTQVTAPVCISYVFVHGTSAKPGTIICYHTIPLPYHSPKAKSLLLLLWSIVPYNHMFQLHSLYVF